MNCSQCGTAAPAGASYCAKCGRQLPEPSDVPANAATAPATAAEATTAPLGRRRVADVPEQVLWEGGISAKSMFGTWLLAGLASLAALAAMAFLFSAGNKLAGCGLLAAVLLLWLYLAVQFARVRLGLHYKLTNQRLFYEHGIFRHVVDRIEVIAIEDLAYEQGVLDRIVGTGRIKIISGDRSNPELYLSGIDDVQTVFGLIDKARRAERLRRSVSIDAIGSSDLTGGTS
jgi:hypothetical protein